MGDLPVHFGPQPRFAVLTPCGRGAVATIGVRGQGVLELVGRRFRPVSGKQFGTFGIGQVVYGRFRSVAATDEDVVVGILADGEIEIHCHGGEAAARAICESLAGEGGMELTAQDWVSESAADRISAAALKDLASARTERAAAILLDQYGGALGRKTEQITKLLTKGMSAEASEGIQVLLRWADVGLHLTQPWKVVFAGRPNVGKSSLMNAILGYERSIVWPEPGTTRDVLMATTAIDGWWVELSDVAGLRASGEVIEAAGIARAVKQIAAADLVVFVADATVAWDKGLYDSICGVTKRQLVVHNKCDLEGAWIDGRPPGAATSAVTGSGVKELCREIGKSLVRESPPRGSAVPFTTEQVQTLARALAELQQGNVNAALQSIRELHTPAATE